MLEKVLLLVLFILVNILDVITTNYALNKGIKELNFIVRNIYNKFGSKGHIILKIFTISIYILSLNILSIDAMIIINIIFILVIINNCKEIFKC